MNKDERWKKYFLSSSTFFLIIIGCEESVAPDTTSPIGITFIYTFGGSDFDLGESVQQTTDGGYIITGYTMSFGNSGRNVWLIKTDSSGTEEWDKTFGRGMGNSVQQTTDGGYIITGNGLIKTDSSGTEEWDRTFGGSMYNSVQQTTDSGYVITGSINFSGNADVYLIKTDSNGVSLWTQTFGGSNSDQGNSVQQTTDGGYIITGYTSSLANDTSDVYLIKTDSDGDSLWTQTIGGSDWDYGRSVQQTADGGYIIVGSTGLYPNTDLLLIKTDSQGNKQWLHTSGDGYGSGSSIQQTIDDGYIITGYLLGDVRLIKLDSNGVSLWTQTFGGSNNDYGHSVQQTTDGGYIIVGSTYSFGNGNLDMFLIKTDSEGNTVPYSE